MSQKLESIPKMTKKGGIVKLKLELETVAVWHSSASYFGVNHVDFAISLRDFFFDRLDTTGMSSSSVFVFSIVAKWSDNGATNDNMDFGNITTWEKTFFFIEGHLNLTRMVRLDTEDTTFAIS